MSFARSAFGALRSARVSVSGGRAQLVRSSARRGYSSGHGQEASSDLPWAVGAVAVTVPTCWFLLKSSPKEAHHLHVPHKIEAHGKHEAKAEEAVEEPKEEAPKEEAPKEEASKQEEPKATEESKAEEEPKAEEKASAADDGEKKSSVDASVAESETKDSEKNTAGDSESHNEATDADAKQSAEASEDSSVSQKA